MKMISFSFILWAFNAIKWQALSTSHSFSFAQFLREKLQLSQLKWSIGQWHCQLLTRVVHQRKHYCPSFLSIVSLALVSFPNLFLKTSDCANPPFRQTRTKTLSLWKCISDIETPQCVVSVLGPFSIHRLITVIFPIVWGVFFRQFSTFGGTRKSLGSGEQRVSCRAAIFQFS